MEGYSREGFEKAQTEEEKNALLEKAHNEATRENKEHDFYNITINRNEKLDTSYIGGWTIVEEDPRSLKLTKIDLNKVVLKSMFNPGEESISREELLMRIKTDKDIHLDVKIFETLLKSGDVFPEEWRQKAITSDYPLTIIFDGSFLRYTGRPESNIGFVVIHWDKKYNRWSSEGGPSSNYASLNSEHTNYMSPVLEVTEEHNGDSTIA